MGGDSSTDRGAGGGGSNRLMTTPPGRPARPRRTRARSRLRLDGRSPSEDGGPARPAGDSGGIRAVEQTSPSCKPRDRRVAPARPPGSLGSDRFSLRLHAPHPHPPTTRRSNDAPPHPESGLPAPSRRHRNSYRTTAFDRRNLACDPRNERVHLLIHMSDRKSGNGRAFFFRPSPNRSPPRCPLSRRA